MWKKWDSRGHQGRPLLFGTTPIYEAVCPTVTRNAVCSFYTLCYMSKHAGTAVPAAGAAIAVCPSPPSYTQNSSRTKNTLFQKMSNWTCPKSYLRVMPKIQNWGLCKGFSTQVGFSTPKWKILDSYVLLIAEKSTRLHTNRTPGLTPRRSPGRIQRKVLPLIIVKIKNAQNLKWGSMEKALAPK